MRCKPQILCAEKLKKVTKELEDWENELEAQKLSDQKVADQLPAKVSSTLCRATRLLSCFAEPFSAAVCVVWGVSQ